MNVSPALIPAHCALLLETLLVQNANLDTMRSTQCVPNAIPPAKLVLQIPPANRVRMVITSMDPFAQLAPQVACSAQTLTLAHRAQLLTIWMEFANNAPLDSSFQATLARIANSSNNTCSQCTAPCKTCSSANVCKTCQDHYYFNSSDSTCLPCTTPCLNCSASGTDSCETCKDTTYYIDVSTCKSCVSPCLTCTTISACLNCVSGFYFAGSAC